jgi:hypothetical protein
MKFAKWVYRVAGVYGLLVIAPMLFLESEVSRSSPPAITHPEYYYGFAITALAWQVAFLVISRDPVRFRSLMPVSWIEKTFGVFAVVLYAQGRVPAQVCALGFVDLVLGALFVAAYFATPRSGP